MLAEFVAQLRYLSSSQVSYWMYFVPFSKQRAVSRYLQKAALRILDSLDLSPEARKSIFNLVDIRMVQLRAEDKKISKDRRETILHRFTSSLHDGNYVYWHQVEQLAEGKVYTYDEIEAIRVNDEAAEKKARGIEAFLKAERCAMALEK